MLFSSATFLFAFLPIVLGAYFALRTVGSRNVLLVVVSLLFYAWGELAYTLILIGSIALNYAFGLWIDGARNQPRQRWVLALALSLNLLILGYFKYANFFVDTLNSLLAPIGFSAIAIDPVHLPIGISFFTFQAMTYVVDVYRDNAKVDRSPWRVGLYIALFPQLIAGPIVHHGDMLPQFRHFADRVSTRWLAIGTTVFIAGLFKKVVIADGLAIWATPVFAAADQGAVLGALEAWCGTFAYTFQLYFDFSGYSDMAIGLGLMFGIRLPINFNSPYRAHSIIEFWRCWHMTLSRFLRDYVYFPLGGNRQGSVRRYVNLMLTMLIGGLWHGAGWNFVFWGGLHGFYLVANHLWRAARPTPIETYKNPFTQFACWSFTLAAVAVAWVPFRAETSAGSVAILNALTGATGLSVSDPELFFGAREIVTLLGLAVSVRVLPNVYEFMREHAPEIPVAGGTARGWRLSWQERPAWAVTIGIMAALSLISLHRVSEFLYFQF